jgi:hypothetical protein
MEAVCLCMCVFVCVCVCLCVCVCVCVCVHIFYADLPDKTVRYPEGYNNNLIIIYRNCIVEQSVKFLSVTILSRWCLYHHTRRWCWYHLLGRWCWYHLRSIGPVAEMGHLTRLSITFIKSVQEIFATCQVKSQCGQQVLTKINKALAFISYFRKGGFLLAQRFI